MLTVSDFCLSLLPQTTPVYFWIQTVLHPPPKKIIDFLAKSPSSISIILQPVLHSAVQHWYPFRNVQSKSFTPYQSSHLSERIIIIFQNTISDTHRHICPMSAHSTVMEMTIAVGVPCERDSPVYRASEFLIRCTEGTIATVGLRNVLNYDNTSRQWPVFI